MRLNFGALRKQNKKSIERQIWGAHELLMMCLRIWHDKASYHDDIPSGPKLYQKAWWQLCPEEDASAAETKRRRFNCNLKPADIRLTRKKSIRHQYIFEEPITKWLEKQHRWLRVNKLEGSLKDSWLPIQLGAIEYKDIHHWWSAPIMKKYNFLYSSICIWRMAFSWGRQAKNFPLWIQRSDWIKMSLRSLSLPMQFEQSLGGDLLLLSIEKFKRWCWPCGQMSSILPSPSLTIDDHDKIKAETCLNSFFSSICLQAAMAFFAMRWRIMLPLKA